jgi:hypothetical protein
VEEHAKARDVMLQLGDLLAGGEPGLGWDAGQRLPEFVQELRGLGDVAVEGVRVAGHRRGGPVNRATSAHRLDHPRTSAHGGDPGEGRQGAREPEGIARCPRRPSGGLDAAFQQARGAGPSTFSARFLSLAPENLSEMRLLWTYLILGVIFAFGFVCAAMFTVGMPTPRRAPRGAKPSPPAWRAHPQVDFHDD